MTMLGNEPVVTITYTELVSFAGVRRKQNGKHKKRESPDAGREGRVSERGVGRDGLCDFCESIGHGQSPNAKSPSSNETTQY